MRNPFRLIDIKMAVTIMFSIFISFLSTSSALPFDLEPGDDAPPFRLETLQEPVFLQNKTVFYALDNRSAFVECMWTKDESVDHLIQNSTDDVQYVFMSYSNDPRDHVMWMQSRLKARVSLLSERTGNSYEKFVERCHFVVDQAGHTNTWIDWLVKNWTCKDFGCGINQLNVTTKNGTCFV